MYIYFDKKGTLTTIIPHGETVRQGNDIHLVVCFDSDFNRFKSNLTIQAKMRGETDWSSEYNFSNPHNIVFTKLYDSEMTYDLIDNTKYVAYDINIPYSIATKIFGKGKLIVNVLGNLIGTRGTLRELDELNPDDGDIGCLLVNGKASYYVYNSSGTTVDQRWTLLDISFDPNTKNFYQGLVDYYVEPTYGEKEPTTPDISKSEYDRLMQTLGGKVDVQNGIARNIEVTIGEYHDEQDFTDSNVRVKEAVDDNEAVALSQLKTLDTSHKELLDKKVDKFTQEHPDIMVAYVQKGDSNQTDTVEPVSSTNLTGYSSIVGRDANGNFESSNPTKDLHVVNKQTLDKEVATLDGEISSIKEVIPSNASKDNKLVTEAKFANFATKDDLEDYALKADLDSVKEVIPSDASSVNKLITEANAATKTDLSKYTPLTEFNAAISDMAKKSDLDKYTTKTEFNQAVENLATKTELTSYTPLATFNALKGLVPSEASTDNLLADRNWVVSQIGTVYRYKGSVDNYSDLPTNAENGDVWNVVNAYLQYPAGTNYAWNGTKWDALGGHIDLSAYVTQTSLTTTLNDYATKTLLTQTLESYATKEYVTTALGSYATKADLDSYATKTMLSNYVTNSALTELLGSYATLASLNSHVTNTANPHKVTKEQLGLGNVDNTSDLNKPISTATQEEIDSVGHELSISNNVVKLLDANGTAISQINLPEGGKIDTISVNGVQQSVVNKNVDITTPIIEILESGD